MDKIKAKCEAAAQVKVKLKEGIRGFLALMLSVCYLFLAQENLSGSCFPLSPLSLNV